MGAQIAVEFRPAFFGEEDPCALDLHQPPGAGDGIPTKHPEPMEHYDMG